MRLLFRLSKYSYRSVITLANKDSLIKNIVSWAVSSKIAKSIIMDV